MQSLHACMYAGMYALKPRPCLLSTSHSPTCCYAAPDEHVCSGADILQRAAHSIDEKRLMSLCEKPATVRSNEELRWVGAPGWSGAPRPGLKSIKGLREGTKGTRLTSNVLSPPPPHTQVHLPVHVPDIPLLPAMARQPPARAVPRAEH